MTGTRDRLTARRAWPTVSLLAIAAFVATSLWARWDISAAEDAPAKKKAAFRAERRQARNEAKKTAAPAAPAKSLTAGKQVDHRALTQLIDREISRRLQAEGVKPAPLADDAEFLRRVYLDLVGVIPPADKVKEFLDSKDPQKREKVIDELLADPRFGKCLAETWTVLMVPRESNNRALNNAPFQKWLGDAFNAGKPLDQIVYDLVTATGTQTENGAVTYFIGNPSVDKITDNVTRMFLGVQLQCAQCHNHPFTDYKQTEYWEMAAFFMKTRVNGNPQQAAKKGIEIAVQESPKAPNKKNALPESAKILPAKFLRGEQPKLDPAQPHRPALAKWMTSADNPYFARAMVNRFWYQMFGRGLVTPVDDMHADNAPSHPDLLLTMTEQFKMSGFDVKYLLRAICNSEAYQRSSAASGDTGSDDLDLYSKRLVRSMSPEQLYDSLVAVLGRGEGRPEVRDKTFKRGPQTGRDTFLNFFRVEDANPLDYQAGIPQALRLMNSAMGNNLTAPVNEAMKEGKTSAEVIEALYLRALSRRPTADETRRLTEYVTRHTGNRQAAYGDVLWALLNTSEFVLNH